MSILFDATTHKPIKNASGEILGVDGVALPEIVNDRYLHTNASTGALEWTEVAGSNEPFICTVSDDAYLLYNGNKISKETVVNTFNNGTLQIQVSNGEFAKPKILYNFTNSISASVKYEDDEGDDSIANSMEYTKPMIL